MTSAKTYDILDAKRSKYWQLDVSDLEQRLDAEFYLPEHLALIRKIRDKGNAIPLGEIEIDGAYGILPGSDEYGQGNLPLVRGQDLEGVPMTRIPESAPLVPDSYYNRNRGTLRANEVLLLIKGATIDAPESVGIVSENWHHKAIANGSIYKFKVKVPHDPYYLSAFFGSKYGLFQKTRAIANTGIFYNDQDAIRNFLVPLPSPEIQRTIGNKIRKAERLRELAEENRSQCAEAICSFYGRIEGDSDNCLNWVPTQDVSSKRIDAWFHKRSYLRLSHWLENRPNILPVKHFCSIINKRANLNNWHAPVFDYYEISGINLQNGMAIPSTIAIEDAPSRAITEVQSGDLLVSTVRPNLKAIGQISANQENAAVASSGFCVLRAQNSIIGAYVRCCLIHEYGTAQLMRWNSGGTYPAIEQAVPLKVLIPYPGDEALIDTGQRAFNALSQDEDSLLLIKQAKKDIEALIDGTLDQDALLDEGTQIETWLREHPSPNTGETHHA